MWRWNLSLLAVLAAPVVLSASGCGAATGGGAGTPSSAVSVATTDAASSSAPAATAAPTPIPTAVPTPVPTPVPTASPTPRPTAVPAPPPPPPAAADPHQAAYDAGATAICADGSYSYSAHRSGTCSSHGGVSWWTGRVGPAGPSGH